MNRPNVVHINNMTEKPSRSVTINDLVYCVNSFCITSSRRDSDDTELDIWLVPEHFILTPRP